MEIVKFGATIGYYYIEVGTTTKGRFTLWPKVERPSIFANRIKCSTSQPFTLWTKVVAILNYYFLTKATNSQRKFGLDRNGNPNYGREAANFFH